MEVAHEPGCDGSHEPGQRCAVPGAFACPSCGEAASPDANFCGYCGAALQGAPADQPPAPPTHRQSPAVVYSPGAVSAQAQRTSTGTAVLLELVPLLWIVVLLLRFALGWIPGLGDAGGGLMWMTGLAALVSGIGWIAIGRPGIGCSLMALRAVGMIVAVVALVVAVSDWDCRSSDCTDNGAIAVLSVVGGLTLLVIAPIVSAVALAATQRGRA